jgi:hypothetical protein
MCISLAMLLQLKFLAGPGIPCHIEWPCMCLSIARAVLRRPASSATVTTRALTRSPHDLCGAVKVHYILLVRAHAPPTPPRDAASGNMTCLLAQGACWPVCLHEQPTFGTRRVCESRSRPSFALNVCTFNEV